MPLGTIGEFRCRHLPARTQEEWQAGDNAG